MKIKFYDLKIFENSNWSYLRQKSLIFWIRYFFNQTFFNLISMKNPNWTIAVLVILYTVGIVGITLPLHPYFYLFKKAQIFEL